jgi:hypothetical protein
MAVVGIISALIRFAPGLEGGSYVGAYGHSAERSCKLLPGLRLNIMGRPLVR